MNKSTTYSLFLPQARELERHIDTDWADEHADAYDGFASLLEYAWDNGDLTDAEFNALASIAFYDYSEGLKGDEDDEDLIEQELALDQPDRRVAGRQPSFFLLFCNNAGRDSRRGIIKGRKRSEKAGITANNRE